MSARDRQARSRGQALLRALSGLQAALLAGPGEAACALRQVATLLDGASEADDPALADTLAQVTLRAQIELARG